MAYIGNTTQTQNFVPAVDYFSGNGSTTAFTLSRPVASVVQVEAVISNVVQNPSSAYSVSGNTITFTSAPPSGTNNIYVRYTSPVTQVIGPSQGTVYPSSLSTGGMYWDTSGNVGIGTTSNLNYTSPLHVYAGSNKNFVSEFYTGGANYKSTIAFTNDYSGAAIGSNSGSLVFYASDATVERMRIDTSGNVGIGTSSPTAKLQELVNTTSGTTDTVQKWSWSDAGVSATWGLQLDQIHTGSAIDYAFRIRPNSSTPLTALYMQATTGNVGIGTSSPGAKLQVYAGNGTGQVTMDVTGGGSAGDYSVIQVSNAGTTKGRLVASNFDTSFRLDTAGSSTGFIQFLTGSSYTERMRITSNGGVSFGSSGTAYGTSGQVLQSNGDAAPTWVAAPSPTTANVLTATAGYTFNVVGSFIAIHGVTGGCAVNATTAGSNLLTVSTSTGGLISAGCSGTWRNLGGIAMANPAANWGVSIFVRTA